MSFASALYTGHVLHVRHRPKRHRLRYSVFSLLVDLDELQLLCRNLKLFGHNRRAVFSVHDADHGDGKREGLKSWVAGHLADAGIAEQDLRVTMLCYPRIFGFVFNPLTVYFCSRGDGALVAILYEVCNTFGERHTYVIPVEASGHSVRHECAKRMYVSPFVPMNCTYRFNIKPPGEAVAINIGESDEEGPLLFASFVGERREISDAALLRMLLTYPLMTLKVVVGIHWEALLLWLKRTPIYRHTPAAIPVASTVVLQNEMEKP